MSIYRALYHALIAVGRPFGGIRPRRLYDALGRRAYPEAEFTTFQNTWGAKLSLTHAFHIDRNILIHGCYDRDLHLILERRVKAGMVCLDVGANLGEMALHMAARCQPGGHVYAFEPMPHVYQRLVKHVQMNALDGVVSAYPLALSDSQGRIPIFSPPSDADNQGLASIVGSATSSNARSEIEATTLDQFSADQKLTRLDLIKVDIQGAEVKFLRGAENTLRKFKPDLLLEVSPGDLLNAGATSRDLLREVAGLGYAVYRLRGAEPAERIDAEQIPENFSATNVLCTRAQ